MSEVQSSVKSPSLFHDNKSEEDDDCCRFPLDAAESSGEFFGMRKGALDLDMAERSEELGGVVVEE